MGTLPPSITDFAAEQLEELEGVKLEGVKLEGVKLEGVELEGVELEELELEELEAFAFGFEPPRLDPV